MKQKNLNDLAKSPSLLIQIYTMAFTLIWYIASRYSWPNVVLCLFGGFLLDRVFGIRLGTIIFCLFITGGQLIFALGMIDAA